jgi:protease II
MVTNAGCQDYKLVQADPSSPNSRLWTDLLVPDPGTKIEDIDVFRHHIVVYERTCVGQQIRILLLSDTIAEDAKPAGLVQFSQSCGFPHETSPLPRRPSRGLRVVQQRLVALPGELPRTRNPNPKP